MSGPGRSHETTTAAAYILKGSEMIQELNESIKENIRPMRRDKQERVEENQKHSIIDKRRSLKHKKNKVTN